MAAVSRFMYVIAGCALAGSMFLTVADVILRSFKRPILGTYELVGLLGAITIAFAIPQTTRVRGHVLMDFVTSLVPKAGQTVLYVLTRLLAIAIFWIMASNLWSLGNDYKKVGEVTLTLQLPVYPIAWCLAACCLVECIVLFWDIFEHKGAQE